MWQIVYWKQAKGKELNQAITTNQEMIRVNNNTGRVKVLNFKRQSNHEAEVVISTLLYLVSIRGRQMG